MNKSHLIERIAKDAKITKAKANACIDAFVKATQESVKKGQKVTLVGFGTFSLSKRKARPGRNPQNGKTITIPARKVVKFRAGKDFAKKVK